MRKKDVILIGNTHFAVLVKNFIQTYEEYSVVAFSVNEEFKSGNFLDGIPVVAFEDIEKKYPPKEYDLLIAVGYKKMNQIRERLYLEAKAKGYNLKNFIHPTAIVETQKLGEGNIILENTLFSIGTELGNCNLIWDNVAVRHDAKIGSFNQISGHSSICGFVTIANNCFLGTNCTIEPEISIADFTLVGAGTHMKESTQEHSVYVPPRALKLEKDSLDFF